MIGNFMKLLLIRVRIAKRVARRHGVAVVLDPRVQMAILAYSAFSTVKLSWWFTAYAYDTGRFDGVPASFVYAAPFVIGYGLWKAWRIRATAAQTLVPI